MEDTQKSDEMTLTGKAVSCSPAFSSVRISTIPAFGTIMETVTQKEVEISQHNMLIMNALITRGRTDLWFCVCF